MPTKLKNILSVDDKRGRAARNKPFRNGLVVAIDTTTDPSVPVVQVQFEDYGNMISAWLQVLVQGTHSAKQFWLPQIGDQVAILFDDRTEAGVVLGALYSDADGVPGMTSPSPLRITSDGAGSTSGTPLTGSLDDMFTQAALTCAGLATALAGVSGKNILKGLAISESNLVPTAMSEPARDGSRSWGLMQINTTSHPGFSPTQLTTDEELNIRLGTADLCGKLTTYGDIRSAVGHYKGWSGTYGSSMSPTGQAQVDTAIAIMQGLT